MEVFLLLMALFGGTGGSWWYWHYQKKPNTPAEELPEVTKQWPWSWLDKVKPGPNDDNDPDWKDKAFEPKD